MITPDVLIDHLSKALAFDGSDGTDLDGFWRFASDKAGALSDFEKSMIWNWACVNSNNIEVHGESGRIETVLELDQMVAIYESNIILKPSEDIQWKYLTSSQKLNNPIGQSSFNLLCVIAKHKSTGIAASQLSKITGQDPRSLTARINKLAEYNLIRKKPILFTSHNTFLIVHKVFWDNTAAINAPSDSEAKDRFELRIRTVEILKAAPDMSRDVGDLRAELRLDGTPENKKTYRRMISSLIEGGYIQRVSTAEKSIIKFAKDLSKEVIESLDFIDTGDDGTFDKENSVDQGSQEEVNDVSGRQEGIAFPVFNSIFPSQNQLFQLVKNSGKSGATTMKLIETLVGSRYQIPFIRIFEPFISDRKSKIQGGRASYSIIRGYDFDGKSKFFRYFTSHYYNELSGDLEVISKNEFSRDAMMNKSLGELTRESYKPLVRCVELLKDSENKDFIYWHGESSTLTSSQLEELREKRNEKKRVVPVSSNGPRKKKRGRPKKESMMESVSTDHVDQTLQSEPLAMEAALREVSSTSMITEDSGGVATSKPDNSIPALVAESQSIEISEQESAGVRKMVKKDSKPQNDLLISFKSDKRRNTLLSLIKEAGAICITSDIIKKMDVTMGSSSSTDRKTIARDISYLIKSNKIATEDFRVSPEFSRKIIYLKDSKDDSAIQRAKEVASIQYDISKSKNTSETPKRVYKGTSRVSGSSIKNPQSNNVSDKAKKTIKPFKEKTKKPTVEAAVQAPEKEEKVKGKKSKNSDSIIETLPKKRASKISRKKPKVLQVDPITGKVMRTRMPFDFNRNDATTLYRAVIISRSFSSGGIIEWEKVSALYENLDADTVKKKWPRVRRLLGGAEGLLRGMNTWEKILFQAISDGIVTSGDLENLDYEFFLHLWKDRDSTDIETDSMPLFSKVDDNSEEYEFSGETVSSNALSEFFSDLSMVQKNSILSNNSFSYKRDERLQIKKHENIRTTLKAIFATSSDDFLGTTVKRLLADYDDTEAKEALTALLDDKEIAFFTQQDAETRFSLTEKFQNTFNQKMSKEFFIHASQFFGYLSNILQSKRGLIVSPAIENGSMSTVISLLDAKEIQITRVDKMVSDSFHGYESRLIEKEKLDCDIIFTGDVNWGRSIPKKVPVPITKACGHIWLDTNGNINSNMWINIVSTITTFVLFRPGVTKVHLYEKLSAVLSSLDLDTALNWLVGSGYIRQGNFQGYWVTDNWFLLMGVEE